MTVEHFKQMAVERFAKGDPETVVQKHIINAGCDKAASSVVVRIARLQHYEDQKLEPAIQLALDALDEGVSVEQMTIDMMAVEGMYLGSKAAHIACLRKGITPTKRRMGIEDPKRIRK